ncbi:hypothetical protein AYK20_08470 [Thermoplasmatales archaeon SG8-52-1]|nr:MAG: hypothetical protein AYK20_08470 [Thermoplasmatales archaeon SG8-52-1]
MELNFYKKSLFLFFIFMVCISFIISPLNGLSVDNYKKIQEKIANEGYILFAPERTTETYLINYNKEVVYSWDSDYNPSFSVYLLSSGNLLHTSYLGFHPIFYAMGMAGGFQEIGFNGDIVWDFKYRDNTHLSHHDVEPLPNGNVLMIAWEYKSHTEAEKAGRNPINIPYSGLWPDHVIEVNKTGPTSGIIVWEWHVWDHLIQDYNPSKDNYGVVKDHPELIDINFGDSSCSDWLHSNSIDYNEEFDQIIISVRNFNEFWVIDHSTTTEEAAGHTGGNSGKGGDILYRWGNPRAYRAGTVYDQKLFRQHDANWIESGCPGEGNILVFNNGIGRPEGVYSSVDEIVQPVDDNGNYYLEPGEAYGPEEPTWVYKSENPEDFFSASRSGAQRLIDGHTLICNAEEGYFFEVTSDGDIVWDYVNPYPDYINNIVFKVHRYESYYPGIIQLLQPPETPSIPSGPTLGIVGVEYEYSSKTSDPNGNQIFYKYDWNDGTDSGWIGPYDSGETCVSDHVWNNNGSYKVKVKAKDFFNLESDWSNHLNVIIGNIPPELPTISGPTHGRIGVEYDYIFKAIDLNNNKIRYIIDWGDGTSYTSDFYPSGTDITLSHNWTDKGKYVISAKAQDSLGLIGPEKCLYITISRSKATYDFLFHRFFVRYPILEKIFYHLI